MIMFYRQGLEMDSERGGLLKTRAEDFARHLHTRLRSLTSNDSSWTAEDEINEVYSDIDSSLASPEEELAEPIFITDQNESFPLQRDGSTDSQYFDSVENIEDLSPVEVKKIPILHLRTESKPIFISNGHRNLQDVDSGCSRVQEVASVDLASWALEKDNEENNCDIEALKENNNLKNGSDNEALLIVTNGDVFDDEKDKRHKDETGGPLEEAEEASEIPSDSFCVFCDIEQIKCSLSNGCLQTEQEKEALNGECGESTIEENADKLTTSTPSSEVKNEFSPDIDENVSLADLLQVLKQEVIEQKQSETNPSSTEKTEISQRECPDIQVHESSPVVSVEQSHTEEDDDDIETKRRHFRRCSSLKTGKTPPGTPGRKKIVRFADVLGLDLADVKTFLDEVPTVPKSAYEDLHGIELSSSPVLDSPLARIAVAIPKAEKVLIPLFQQPSMQPNFLDRVRNNNVCLESAYVSDSAFSAISGLVRVKNIDFHKSVYIRYSIDKWRSFSDLQAKYVPSSCDGFSDKFTFVLYAHTLTPGQRLEFAVRYHSCGAQYWDNNGGNNYIFECINQVPPDPGVPPSPMETWAAFY